MPKSDVFTIEMIPVAASRPRSTIMRRKGVPGNKPSDYFVHVYTDSKYKKYKDELVVKINRMGLPKIPKGVPTKMNFIFYFPFPKSTPKKYLVEGQYMITKPDWDNISKGVQDAITDACVINDDNQVCDVVVKKRRTTGTPRVEFYYAYTKMKTQ